MNGWFIAICIMYALGLGINIAKHGEPKDDEYNALISLISIGINLTLIIMAIKTGF